MPEITQPIADCPAKDAFRHRLSEDGRESLTHQFVLPHYGIAGFYYPTVRANGHAKGRLFLFGPAFDAPIEEQVETQVADDLDFDDWRFGPLLMAVREPHKVVDLGWSGDRIQFEGRWEALHPPYAFSSHPKGNPPYYGDDRTEQHGIVKGNLCVDGRNYPLNNFMIRDHSWGPRVWGLNQHYKWIHATTAGASVHFFEMQSFGRVELRGYLYKNGVMRHIRSVDYEIDYDSRMMHDRFQVTVTDTDGRSVFVDCQAFAKYQLDLDPKVLLNESVVTATIDGEAGTGWCEFCWNRDYLKFAKPYVRRFG
ncbi:DUF7064 domain-containing protein [Novosphingobium rosa]|uniref:DUF7064 domain-containing protein n=1 Tax=Novosphingobium rosa TaxID=76978 RepID=UPI00082EECAB|nr:hypothetical protein [Novosphingobium rosa]